MIEFLSLLWWHEKKVAVLFPRMAPERRPWCSPQLPALPGLPPSPGSSPAQSLSLAVYKREILIPDSRRVCNRVCSVSGTATTMLPEPHQGLQPPYFPSLSGMTQWQPFKVLSYQASIFLVIISRASFPLSPDSRPGTQKSLLHLTKSALFGGPGLCEVSPAASLPPAPGALAHDASFSLQTSDCSVIIPATRPNWSYWHLDLRPGHIYCCSVTKLCHIRWPKYWSFSIGSSSEYSGIQRAH